MKTEDIERIDPHEDFEPAYFSLMEKMENGEENFISDGESLEEIEVNPSNLNFLYALWDRMRTRGHAFSDISRPGTVVYQWEAMEE